jgi:hypothetical protein
VIVREWGRFSGRKHLFQKGLQSTGWTVYYIEEEGIREIYLKGESMLTKSRNAVLLSIFLFFSTFAQVPAGPVLVSPTNGATNVPCSAPMYHYYWTATFAWDSVIGASSYIIQIGTSSTFSSPLINAAGITTTSFKAVGDSQTCDWCSWGPCTPMGQSHCIECGPKYYWHIGAIMQKDTEWSVIDSFSNIDIPIGVITGLTTFSVSLQNWTTKNTMNYTLPSRSFISINLYNAQGRLIRQLVNRIQEEGKYSCKISDLAYGTYLLAFKAGNYQFTKAILMAH